MEEKMSKDMKQIPCEIFTRVAGYYRPVNQFNKGKKEEFNERVYIIDKKGKLDEEKKG